VQLKPEELLAAIPDRLLDQSGAIFYSGREAFTRPSPLYVLGLNPGGDPHLQRTETVRRNVDEWRHEWPSRWSSYVDESWRKMAPGTCGMQPRVRHLIARSGLDARLVPASNVIFVRTRSEADLARDKPVLLQNCWEFHRAVIKALRVRVVACFGRTAGELAREKLNAHTFVDAFTERNRRGWTSEAHKNEAGVCVATLTHPSRANWCNAASDPSPLIRNLLGS